MYQYSIESRKDHHKHLIKLTMYKGRACMKRKIKLTLADRSLAASLPHHNNLRHIKGKQRLNELNHYIDQEGAEELSEMPA